MKSWMSDVLVTLSTLAIASGFAYLYYQDLNRRIDDTGRVAIGTITFKQNTAERRFGDRAVWQGVAQKSPLFDKDSVRTAGDSQAIIRLDDGTEISLGANTMVTLDWGKKEKSVDFLGGSITAIRSGSSGVSSAAVTIRSGESRVTLDRATVNLAQSAGKLGVSVASGQANLSSSGRVQTITSEQSALLGGDGAVTLATQAIVPLSPAPSAIYLANGRGAEVAFSWRPRDEARVYRLEIADDPGFSRNRQSFEAATASVTHTVPLGVHYWRVSAGEEKSVTAQLTVLADPAVVPRMPAANQLFGYVDKPSLVDFAWSPSSLTSNYQLQIADNSTFTGAVRTIAVSSTQIAVDSLGEGTYSWRILPVYAFSPANTAPQPVAASFRVVHNQSLSPARLVAPADRASFTTLALASGGLLFNWQADSSIKSWTLVCAKDSALTQVVVQATLSDNFRLVRSDFAAGTYYWQVSGVDASGTQAPLSETRSFLVQEQTARITLTSPRENYVYDGSTFANVPSAWTSDIQGSFQVDLSTNADFSVLYKQLRTSITNGNFGSLPPSSYFWRVLLVGTDGRTLLSSPTASFTVMPSLVAPAAVAPAAGEALKLINPVSLAFRWDGDPRTTYYDFALYQINKEGGHVLINRAQDLTVNEYTITDFRGLSVGSYAWEVRAHNPPGANVAAQQSPSTLTPFAIESLRLIPAPVLVAPASRQQIDGLSALKAGVGFSWDSPSATGTGLVEIAKDSSFTQELIQRSAPSAVTRITVLGLLPGTYYWQVKARTTDGLDAPPSSVNQFTVLPFPPLARPQSVSPGAGESVVMWDKKTLSFSWSAIPDATSYSISLTEPTTGRTVFTVPSLASTSYDYDDLRNLDEGEFVWSLQATQVDADGRLLRRSPLVTVKFTITLGKKIGPTDITAPTRVFVQ